MGVIKAAIKNKKVTIFLVCIVILVGMICYSMISKQESPDVAAPAAMITTVYPGASPSDVEKLVTKKVEDKVEEIDGYDYVESFSRNNVSIVILYLTNDVDKDKSWTDLRDKMRDIKSDLPDGCQDPVVNTKLSETAGMILSISGKNYNYEQLGSYAEEIKKELGGVSGISRFEIKGKQDKVVKVEIDLEKINKYSISVDEICGILKAQNIDLPSGNLKYSSGKINVKVPGSYTSLKEIENTIIGVSTNTGQMVRIKDIARVYMGYDDNTSNSRYNNNGENAVLLTGYFQQNKNIIPIGDSVREKLKGIRNQLPDDIKIDEVTFQPKDVSDSVSFFMENLREGVLLVIITVLIGMGFRNAMVVSAVIPISISMSFIIMYIMGIKIQQMSTTALIIALGILVDDAIVIGDVIQVGIDEGLTGDEAAITGIKKLFVPVFTSTLIIIGAFSPLLTIPGVVGEFMKTLPQVVMICVTCSYLSAMFVTPAMSSLFFKKSKEKKREPILKKMFAYLLDKGFIYKKTIIAVAVVLFSLSLLLLSHIGMQFFPHADKNIVYIDITNSKSGDIDNTEKLTRQVENIAKSQKEVTGYSAGVGAAMPKFYITLPTVADSEDVGQIMVKIDLKKTKVYKTREEFAEHLQGVIDSQISGGTATVKLLEQAMPMGAPIRIRLTGDKMDQILQARNKIEEQMRGVQGTLNVRDDAAKNSFEYQVNIDSDKAMQLGVLKSDILKQINIALRGYNSSVYRKNGNDYNIIVKTDITSVKDLMGLKIKSSVAGNKVPLNQIAEIKLVCEADQIKHYQKDKTVALYSDIKTGYNTVNIEDEIKSRIDKLDLNGVNVTYDGEKHQIQKNFTSLGVAGLMTIGVIYVLLFVQFKSFKLPLIIMCSLPLSLIGVAIGLKIFGMPVSLTATMGLISLIGVVIRNAILLIEYINEGRSEGLKVEDACRTAVSQRFRPIILSSTATVTALIPLAFSGSALFGPMSVTIMFGLLTATFLTFVIVPVIYSMAYHD